jgi:hypothetical protein
VRALVVVVGYACGKFGSHIVEIEEQRLIQELIARPAVEALG